MGDMRRYGTVFLPASTARPRLLACKIDLEEESRTTTDLLATRKFLSQ